MTIITPDEIIATITAINLSVRFISGSIGYAIYFNILQNKVAEVLPTAVAVAATGAGLQLAEVPALIEALVNHNETAIGLIEGITPAIILAADIAVKDSYVEGFKKLYLVSIAFGGAALVSSLFVGDIRKYMVPRVAVDIH